MHGPGIRELFLVLSEDLERFELPSSRLQGRASPSKASNPKNKPHKTDDLSRLAGMADGLAGLCLTFPPKSSYIPVAIIVPNISIRLYPHKKYFSFSETIYVTYT